MIENFGYLTKFLAAIPLEKLHECSIEVIEDQLYTDKALTDLEHRAEIEKILKNKREM